MAVKMSSMNAASTYSRIPRGADALWLPAQLNVPELRAELGRRGMSRNQLAISLGYNPITLYRWYNGKTRPCLGDVYSIEKFLQIKPRSLVLAIYREWR